MRQRRRVFTVRLLVRPRGTTSPHMPKDFRAHATSPHHAEQLARAFAEKNFDIGHRQ
jgi:hypothetical protein